MCMYLCVHVCASVMEAHGVYVVCKSAGMGGYG